MRLIGHEKGGINIEMGIITILQLPFGDENLFTILLFYIPFILFLLYGQKIQFHMSLIEIGGVLNRLERMRNIAKFETSNVLRKFAKDEKLVEKGLNSLLESFMILPESMDPVGIVKKVEHIVDLREDKLLNEVKRLLNEGLDFSKVKNIEIMVEATMALEIIYKVIRHYYLLAKKMGNLMLVVQLQMILPLIYNEAKAYLSAIFAFKSGAPVGDGIGPFSVHKLLRGEEPKRTLAKDTDVYETDIEGRKAYVVKASGPGGNVGKPSEAIRKIIKEDNKIKAVVMIDAALKLEGEKSGSVADGIGAAIGGIGVEKFKIEEVVTKKNIPIYAIVIKLSLAEAISVINKNIVDAVEEVHNRIKKILVENTKEGDSVIIAGIGNTIGIP